MNKKNRQQWLLGGIAATALLFATGCAELGQQDGNGALDGDTLGKEKQQEQAPGEMMGDTATRDRNGATQPGKGRYHEGEGTYNGKTGPDTGAMPGEREAGARNGTEGMVSEMEARVSSVQQQDSLLIVTDTVRIRGDTRITRNGADVPFDQLNPDDRISVEYRMRDGEKSATEVTVEPAGETTEAPQPQ
jgi:hypothetical protein